MTAPMQRMSVSDPVELATLIPHLVGFHPGESVVVVGAHGPRRRLGLALRLDLVPDDHVAEAAALLAGHIRHSGAERAIVAVFTEAAGHPPNLPQRALVHRLERELELVDAVLVRSGRVWSYRCSDRACCPGEGRPVDVTGAAATRITAGFASIGSGVLPSREALVATLQPAAPRVAAVGNALPAALSWRRRKGQRRCAGWLERQLDIELARFADPRAELEPEVAARLGVVLRELPIRDVALLRWAVDVNGSPHESEPADAWRRMFLDLLRALPAPYDAQPLALFACAAYHDGQGVLVEAAAQRALEHDPGCSFADLLLELLARQVHPRELVAVLAAPLDPELVT